MNKILSASNGISSFTLKVAIPLAILSLQTQALHAADGVELTDSGLELTVTANRRPELANKTLAPITVFTRKQIERLQANTLAEVLAQATGISITNSGGIGKNTAVYIRGADSKQMLVLVDGIPFGSATTGTTAFQFLPLEQIERIEIVRGPRSSLYGSGAIGGVIQLFTRKGVRGFQPSIKLSIGSNNTKQGSVNLSGGNSKTSYNLNVQKESTDGIDACVNGSYPDPGCGLEPDKDGYSSDGVSLKIDHQFASKIKGQFSFLNKDSDTEYDGSTSNETSNLQQSIVSRLDFDASSRLNLQFQVGRSLDESDGFLNGVFTDRFNTERKSASIVSNYKINEANKLIVGLDWSDELVDATDAYTVVSRMNTGVFAGYTMELNGLQLDTTVRYEDNEQFGSKTTGNLSVGKRISDDLRVKASYGTAFKAPSFNDLYFPLTVYSSTFSYIGNEDLIPEESKNFELGFDGTIKNANWEANLFQNKIKNKITYQSNVSPIASTVENIDKVNIKGLEVGFGSSFGSNDWSVNGTLQDPKYASGTNSGKFLIRIPRRILNVNLDRKYGKLGVGVSIHAESERFTDAANTTSLAGFARLDLRANYVLTKNLDLGLKVENVLDKDYSLTENYNQDGINGLLTLSYSPK